MSKCKGVLFLRQNVFKGLPDLKTMLGGEMTMSEFHNFSGRYFDSIFIAKSSLKH